MTRLALVVPLLLAACSAPPPEQTVETSAPVELPPPPPPPPPPAVVEPPPVGAVRPPTASRPPTSRPMAIATRIFLAGNEPIPGQFGAVAVVIFPNGSSPARLQQVCRAFVAVLDDSRTVSERLPDAAQMVTVWPVRDRGAVPRSGVANSPAEADRICAAAAANYDYLRAQQAQAALPTAERLKPTARGPLLAAWAPGANFGQQRVAILRYDLSGVAGDQRLIDAMRIWKDKIERQPELWQSGWNATKVRLWLSTQVDALGAQIGAAMKLVSAGG